MRSTLKLPWLLRIGVATTLLSTPEPLVALTTNITSVADTALFEYDPTNNLGGKTYVIAGTITQGFRNRALFRFNIAAALPTNATITSASLGLTVPIDRGTNQIFHLHRMLKDWGEGAGTGGGLGGGQGAPANPGEATWLAAFHPATLWTSPGGASGSDYVATPSDSQIMGPASLDYSSATMATDIQLWLNSPATNFGWIIIENDETLLATASHISTHEASSDQPVLSIQYTLPAPPLPPIIFGVAQSGNAIRFSFDAQAGKAYTVDQRLSLSAGWSTLTNITAPPASTVVHITNTIAGDEKYYRVRTP